MPAVDPILRPAPATASGALLTAALGGLLFFSSSCGPGDDDPSIDAGLDASAPVDAGQDAGEAQDAGADTDAGADIDAGTDTDAGADLDAGADADAGLDVDAGVPDMDASVALDAGEPLDAGTPLDARCDADRVRVVTSRDAAMPISLEDFTALCDAASGYVEVHPTCGGRNSCAGFSYDQTIGVWSEHTCAGLNTCTGYTCVIP
jgi:hypothetical protein